MALHHTLAAVTQHVIDRSRGPRRVYLDVTRKNAGHRVERTLLSCTNLAHGFAATLDEVEIHLKALERPSLGIVSVYSDTLSAHQPLEAFPAWLRQAVLDASDTAQFAGGMPAMYDGVTQRQDKIELSLFSRNTVALLTAVALSHQMFDAALYLGACDRIVPGLVIGAPSFGRLPAVLMPVGSMITGISNDERTRTRQLYAEGKLSCADLSETGSKSYHGPGMCTFYGTANSNQMLMEVVGPHLLGIAFINPNAPLREVLTRESVRQAFKLVFSGDRYIPIADVLDEHVFVNDIASLLTTGGSTSHTLYLVVVAHVAGTLLAWDDFSDLSGVIPLLVCVYLNDKADANGFQVAGGLSIVIRGLIDAGLLYSDVTTIMGKGLRRHTQEPFLDGEKPVWCDGAAAPLDTNIVRGVAESLSPDGGLRAFGDDIGRLVVKVSAVKPEHRFVEAPTRMSLTQDNLISASKAGEFECGSMAVLPCQGLATNDMPELHKLIPMLSVLQGCGFKVTLVTDGHISDASGKVPATIHITPETLNSEPLAHVCDDGIVVLDAETGTLQVRVPGAEWNVRQVTAPDLSHYRVGVRQDPLSDFCRSVSAAGEGACTLFALAGV